jgi:death-on-curing protein
VIWRFPTVEQIKQLQSRLIETYGGSHGLRDSGLLESAVSRAENTVHYIPDVSVADVGASLAWGLIKNNAFIDGNKRIGAAALLLFLEVNGCSLNCTEAEETNMILRAAASEINEEEFTAWVERSVASIA